VKERCTDVVGPLLTSMLILGLVLILAMASGSETDAAGSPHAPDLAPIPNSLGAQATINATAWFTDVAVEMNAAAPGYGTGVAWGDYDGDGDLDLYVVNLGAGGGGQANVLLRNDGDSFTDVTTEAGVGDAGPGVAAAWADVENDGDLDLFVSNRPGNNALYLNDGDGLFQNVGIPAGVDDLYGMGEGAAWADDDRDGLVDLYVANYTGAPYLNDQPNRLFLNLGDVQFEDVADQRQVAHMGNGEGIAWADFDNDGDQDLYIANAGGINVLFQRQDDGTFDDVTAQMHVPGGPGSSYGAAWGDYDNDGWFDLYVAQQGTNKLYRNLSGADFADVTAEAGVGGSRWSLGCAWGDYDNDGDLDLHVANATIAGYDPGDVLYRNEGGAPITFSDVTALAGVTNTLDARGSAWGDYDGDGDLDLYVVNQGAGQLNRLFRNGGSANHWLQIVPIGSVSNRAGIGARVVATSDGDQMREISGGSGFASQDSLPAEFGLGDWEGTVDVNVQWPSGRQSSLMGLAADGTLTVTEPIADLSGATKAVNTDTALPGEVLTYTIAIPNRGDWAATARVTDTLPPDLTWDAYLTATSGTPIWDAPGRRVLWSGEIGEGSAVTITYRAGIHAGLAPGAIVTNAATVDGGIDHPPFDTAPTTVTVLCRVLSEVGFDYEPPMPVASQVVTFAATATGSLPITFTWDLGDGTGVSGATVTHTYGAEGEYQVILTATNACDRQVVTQTAAVEPPSQWIYLPLLQRDS
jgi:uncharacterized repeat protein (TIGR01451 family)